MRKNKKLSLRQREIKLRNEQKKFIHRINRRDKDYNDSSDLQYERIIDRFPVSTKLNDKGYIEIELPERVDLHTNFNEIGSLLKTIRKLGLRDKKQLCLRFTNVKYIKPSALLIIAAEIHRCRRILGNKKIIGIYPPNKNIERILEDFGFFKLLGVVPRKRTKTKTYPMEYIDFVSHTHEVKGTVRAFRESLLGKSIQMSAPAKGRFYRGITEAMLNVRHHAYPLNASKTNPERGRWWLSGHVNKKSGDLIIMFCDLGVGIPATLPKMYPIEIIRQILSVLPGINPDDGDMIKAAMVLGRTRTLETNRGRGLNDLRSFIDQAQAGELEIFSRKGYYKYSSDGSESTENNSVSIGGTLITWTVPLSTITNWKETEDIDYVE